MDVEGESKAENNRYQQIKNDQAKTMTEQKFAEYA